MAQHSAWKILINNYHFDAALDVINVHLFERCLFIESNLSRHRCMLWSKSALLKQPLIHNFLNQSLHKRQFKQTDVHLWLTL